MVVVGLLDIPPEIQLEIAEFVETLKALSLTSRSLRRIAQSVLFKTLRIEPLKELRGSIDDLLANPRICAAIRNLKLSGYYPLNANAPRNDGEKFSLIKDLFPKTVGLRTVYISHLHLSRMFIDALLEMATKFTLEITLSANKYPPGICPTPDVPLRITVLELHQADIDFYYPILCASAATLTKLVVVHTDDAPITLVGIELPTLYSFSLFNRSEDSEVFRMGASAFITAHRSIRKPYLYCRVGPLPPDALPNLQELSSSIEQVKELVPGRPVEAIVVTSCQRHNLDWFTEEFAKSTAVVRKLSFEKVTTLDAGMVEQMVAIFPSLERLGLCVFPDVSGSFAPYLDSFSFSHYSKSSKSSLPSSASRTYTLICFMTSLKHTKITTSAPLRPICEKKNYVSHFSRFVKAVRWRDMMSGFWGRC